MASDFKNLSREQVSQLEPLAVSKLDDTFIEPTNLEAIREVLIDHLGSSKAADAWLNSPDTGYPTTAMNAIRDGKAELVMADLEQQWGPSPSY